MPRTELTAIRLPQERLVHAAPQHLVDTRHGMAVPIGGARKVLLHVRSDGPNVVTVVVRGGDPEVSSEGNGEDERVQVAPLETRFIGPIETAAFSQIGGQVWLDFTSDSVGRISAYRID
ncbi:MAG: hypothetical protein ACKVVP_01155 [Chloroflexota bacterium]